MYVNVQKGTCKIRVDTDLIQHNINKIADKLSTTLNITWK